MRPVPIWPVQSRKAQVSLPSLAVGVEVAVLLVVVIITIHAALIMIVTNPLHWVFDVGSMRVLLNLINLQCAFALGL